MNPPRRCAQHCLSAYSECRRHEYDLGSLINQIKRSSGQLLKAENLNVVTYKDWATKAYAARYAGRRDQYFCLKMSISANVVDGDFHEACSLIRNRHF